LLRYGVTQAFELRVEGNGFEHVPGHSGFAPASIGFKYHGIIARLFPPSGSDVFKQETTTGDVRYAADIDLSEKWSLNPNVGLAFGSGTDFLAAMTLQYN